MLWTNDDTTPDRSMIALDTKMHFFRPQASENIPVTKEPISIPTKKQDWIVAPRNFRSQMRFHSDTVLWNGPLNSYALQSSQHFLASHVTFGVTQWKPGLPKANTSKENWHVTVNTRMVLRPKNRMRWNLPNDETCSKTPSKSKLSFLPLLLIFPKGNKNTTSTKARADKT